METTPKSLGQIKSLSTTLNNMNVKDMTINNMNIYIGANGTGKTFLLVLIWLCGTITQLILSNPSLTISTIKKILNGLFQKSYDDIEKWSGETVAEFEGFTLTFIMKDGVIDDLTYVKTQDLKPGGSAIFMSKNTRTYNDIERFFEIWTMLDIDNDASKVPELEKLYKAYDIQFCYGVKLKFSNKKELTPVQISNIKSNVDLDIVSIELRDNKFYYINNAGEEKRLAHLSAGQQSYLNMMTAPGFN